MTCLFLTPRPGVTVSAYIADGEVGAQTLAAIEAVVDAALEFEAAEERQRCICDSWQSGPNQDCPIHGEISAVD